MPQIDGHIPFRKVDLLVSFSRTSPKIGHLIKDVQKRNHGLLLSQTEDPDVGFQPHFATLELKSNDNSYNSSVMQLATWLAAGLIKMDQLLERSASVQSSGKAKEESGSSSPMPHIGISVVGHLWHLNLAWKEWNGDIVSLFLLHFSLHFYSVVCLFSNAHSNRVQKKR